MKSKKVILGICSVMLLGSIVTVHGASDQSERQLVIVEGSGVGTSSNASADQVSDLQVRTRTGDWSREPVLNVPEEPVYSETGEAVLRYRVKNDGTAIIIGYEGVYRELHIPEEIDGKRITEIGDNAFKESPFQEVVIADTVQVIGKNAFQKSIYIRSVAIGNGVKTIGENAFESCFGLETVTMGDSVTLISRNAFANCSILMNVSLSQNLEKIEDLAFSYCHCLTEIQLPNSLKVLGDGAFALCSSMDEFTIPANVVEIGLEDYYYLTGSIKITNNSNLEIPVEWLSFIEKKQVGSGWYTEASGGQEVSILKPNTTIYRQYSIVYIYEGPDNGNNPYHMGINDEINLNPLSNYSSGGYDVEFEGWYYDRQYTEAVGTIYGSIRSVQFIYAKQKFTFTGNGTGTGGSSGGSSSGGSSGGSGGGGGSSKRSTSASSEPQLTSYQAITNPTPAVSDGSVVSEGEWLQQDQKWIFKNTAGQNIVGQWVQLDGKRYFIGGDGFMITGWQKINDHWYLFDNSGVMITGWKYVNYKWYFMNDTGAMATGWVAVSGKHYYLDQSGVMAVNTTTPDGYTVNSSGEWVQ